MPSMPVMPPMPPMPKEPPPRSSAPEARTAAERKKSDGRMMESKAVREDVSSIVRLKAHTAEVFSFEWNPTNPNQLASGAGDGTVRLWTLKNVDASASKSGALCKIDEVITLAHSEDAGNGHAESDSGNAPSFQSNREAPGAGNLVLSDVTALNWSHDGKLLSTGDARGNARLFTNTGDLIKVLKGHKGTIFSVGFNPEGTRLLTASYDQKLILWNISKILVAYSSQNPASILGSGSQETVKKSLSDIVNAVDSSIVNIDAKEFVERILTIHTGPVLDLSWRTNDMFASCSGDQTVCVYDLTQKKNEGNIALKGHRSEVNTVKWSPDGRMLASASDDLTSIIWEAVPGASSKEPFTMKTVHHLRGHTREIYTVEWSPDASKLASVSFDCIVRLWDVQSGSCLLVLREHNAPVYGISFSTDNQYLCSGSTDRSVLVYEVSTGEVIRKITTKGNVFEVHFHHEKQKRLAACCGLPGNEICVVDF